MGMRGSYIEHGKSEMIDVNGFKTDSQESQLSRQARQGTILTGNNQYLSLHWHLLPFDIRRLPVPSHHLLINSAATEALAAYDVTPEIRLLAATARMFISYPKSMRLFTLMAVREPSLSVWCCRPLFSFRWFFADNRWSRRLRFEACVMTDKVKVAVRLRPFNRRGE